MGCWQDQNFANKELRAAGENMSFRQSAVLDENRLFQLPGSIVPGDDRSSWFFPIVCVFSAINLKVADVYFGTVGYHICCSTCKEFSVPLLDGGHLIQELHDHRHKLIRAYR